MADNDAKRSRVSNEQILEILQRLANDVEVLKQKTGFNDEAVAGKPEKRNYNTDPGPWTPKKLPSVEEREKVAAHQEERNQRIQEFNSGNRTPIGPTN